jgi:hypothetical protein
MYGPQLDHSLHTWTSIGLPHTVPGRLSSEDFVFFNWTPGALDVANYSVIMTSNDTSGPKWRKIGKLREQIKLPEVILDAYAEIGVLHDSKDWYPSFYSRLNRGSTYIIPIVSKPGAYDMKRLGVLSSGSVNDSN